MPESTFSASGDAVTGYPVLRRLAFASSLLGFAWLVFGSLVAVAVLLRFGPALLWPRLGIACAAVLVGGLLYLALGAIAENTIVLLDIEANTRRSARLLEDLVKRSRRD